jgi:hypothetical protein
MTRDWWWPWWISTAFDLALLAGVVLALVRAHSVRIRAALAVLGCCALAAAVLAPVVMKRPSHGAPPMPMQNQMP